MITRYDAAYLSVLPLALPYAAWRRARTGKYRRSGPGMFGRALPTGAGAERFAAGSVWIHAVSVGEVNAACSVLPGLRALFPGLPFVASTITETGQDAAAAKLKPVEGLTFFPADFSWNVARFLDVYRPKVFILLETEIWPNFITMAAARGARVFMINAKMSDRSFPKYHAFRRALAPVFGSISGFCVQTATDAERFGRLGIGPERIAVTGNCKFDLRLEPLDERRRAEWRAELGLAPGRRVVVVGSTHPGEEDVIFAAARSLCAARADLSFILAPRHPERFDEVFRAAERTGLRVTRSSGRRAGTPAGAPPQIVIQDQMGVLAASYGLGDMAVVAGSFSDVGGHNLLEPAAHSVPVIFGPRMHSQREIHRLFTEAGAGTMTPAADLAATVARFLDDEPLRTAEGRKAHDVLKSNQGSAEASVRAIGGWMTGFPDGG